MADHNMKKKKEEETRNRHRNTNDGRADEMNREKSFQVFRTGEAIDI